MSHQIDFEKVASVALQYALIKAAVGPLSVKYEGHLANHLKGFSPPPSPSVKLYNDGNYYRDIRRYGFGQIPQRDQHVAPLNVKYEGDAARHAGGVPPSPPSVR